MHYVRSIAAVAAVAILITAPRISFAAESSGRQDFIQNCAGCHGADGKGHGEQAYLIANANAKVPDLTMLSKSNGGKFPTRRVYKSIDGRNGIPSHERFDMPFWGTEFQPEGQEFTRASNSQVKKRIMRIVDYIKTIQQQ